MPATEPANATVPSPAARTTAPGAAARSTPRWPGSHGSGGGSNERVTVGEPSSGQRYPAVGAGVCRGDLTSAVGVVVAIAAERCALAASRTITSPVERRSAWLSVMPGSVPPAGQRYNAGHGDLWTARVRVDNQAITLMICYGIGGNPGQNQGLPAW
jgi:hypothetical protein